jgi:hypothetical protein
MTELPENLPEDHFEKLKQKLFDKKEFNTIIIGGVTEKQNLAFQDLMEDILDPSKSADERNDALQKLKEKKFSAQLFETIRQTEEVSKKTALLAMCWEANLDCSELFLYLVDLICTAEFSLAFEALTILEHAEFSFPESEVRTAKAKLSEKLKDASEISNLQTACLALLQQ